MPGYVQNGGEHIGAGQGGFLLSSGDQPASTVLSLAVAVLNDHAVMPWGRSRSGVYL
jgi:hypothetical protein